MSEIDNKNLIDMAHLYEKEKLKCDRLQKENKLLRVVVAAAKNHSQSCLISKDFKEALMLLGFVQDWWKKR